MFFHESWTPLFCDSQLIRAIFLLLEILDRYDCWSYGCLLLWIERNLGVMWIVTCMNDKWDWKIFKQFVFKKIRNATSSWILNSIVGFYDLRRSEERKIYCSEEIKIYCFFTFSISSFFDNQKKSSIFIFYNNNQKIRWRWKEHRNGEHHQSKLSALSHEEPKSSTQKISVTN